MCQNAVNFSFCISGTLRPYIRISGKNTEESVRLEAMVIGKTCTQDWINGVNTRMQECVQQQSTKNNIVHVHVHVRSTEAKLLRTMIQKITVISYVHNACTLSIWKHHRYNIYNNDMYIQAVIFEMYVE